MSSWAKFEFLCLPENLKASTPASPANIFCFAGEHQFFSATAKIFILKELNHFSFLPTGDL